MGQLYHLTDRKVRTKSLHFRILPQLKARLKAKESKATSRPVSHHQSCVYVCVYAQLVSQSCLTLCDPMDYSPPGFSVHGILQARVGCHALFHGIFPTQGSNPGLLCCRQILYPRRYLGNLKSQFSAYYWGVSL